MLRKLIIFLALIVAMVSTQDTFAKSKRSKPRGVDWEAALARCLDVNIESLNPDDCGSDPLTKGKAKIDKYGNVKVVVVGGESEVTYYVHYRSIDNIHEESIGELTTDSDGDGNFDEKWVFSRRKVGSGNIVLRREVDSVMKDQFVTAFKVIGDEEDVEDEESDFEAGLIRCREISRPVALDPDDCGSDWLKYGKVEINHENGDVEVVVRKAVPNVAYDVIYRPFSGDEDIPIGSLITNFKGHGELPENEGEGFFNLNLVAVDIGSGNIVLQREVVSVMKDQFMTGFKVIRKKKTNAKAKKAVFKSSLVQCIEVNQGTDPPSQLSNCGTDSLYKGTVVIDEKGLVRVLLVHAEPKTEYHVFFHPIDGSPEIDLEMTVRTNRAGNANKKKYWFDVGTVGTGNVVLKRSGYDQFVTGFRVNKGRKKR